MEFINIVILILLSISIFSWSLSFIREKKPECEPKIIYRDLPLPLDIQFGEDNYPSKLYKDIFTGGNIWIGGYKYTDSSRQSLQDYYEKPKKSQKVDSQ